jgi:hypothetical protein
LERVFVVHRGGVETIPIRTCRWLTQEKLERRTENGR